MRYPNIAFFPGRCKKKVMAVQKRWLDVLGQQACLAVKRGELVKDTNVDQLVFELLGVYLAHHWNLRVGSLDNADARAINAFERLLEPVTVHVDVRSAPDPVLMALGA